MRTVAKRPTREIKHLTQAQLAALFEAARSSPLRDRLLLAFMYRFALRASEACGLRTSDVDRSGWRVKVRGLKRGEEGSWAIPRDLRALMRGYRPGEAWYFESREARGKDGGRLSRSRVWQIVTGTMRAAGLPTSGPDGFNVHSLRHTAAVHLLDQGRDVVDAQDLLRHRSRGSTAIYAKVSERRRREYMREAETSDAIVKVPSGKGGARPRRPCLVIVEGTGSRQEPGDPEKD